MVFIDVFSDDGASSSMPAQEYISQAVAQLRAAAEGEGAVMIALSGGVDSTVAACLAHQAFGDRLHCVTVDTGFLRKGDLEDVKAVGENLGLKIHEISAAKRFLNALAGVGRAKLKREIIGKLFFTVFREFADQLADEQGINFGYFVQGTIHADVAETNNGVKQHHNTVSAENLGLKPLEPLRPLLKNGVRAIGEALGLSAQFLQRQPFPGPGLAVRVLGEVTLERLEILRRVDAAVRAFFEYCDDLANTFPNNFPNNPALQPSEPIWQIVVTISSDHCSGLKCDPRTGERTGFTGYPIFIRAVASATGETATPVFLSSHTFQALQERAFQAAPGKVAHVLYSITPKGIPEDRQNEDEEDTIYTGTIEFE